MRSNEQWFTGICGFLFLILGAWGCVGPNIYSINMYYDAEKAAIPDYVRADAVAADRYISIAEFNDVRRMTDNLVVGQVVDRNGGNHFVFPKNVVATKAVANGIKNYLRKAGYRVSDKTEQWKLTQEDIPIGDSRVIIGGNIEELEISCRRGVPTSTFKSNIKLNVVIADMVKGRILYKTTVKSSATLEHVLFSENILGEQADVVIADAIERLFEDRAVAQTLANAMAR